MEKYAKKVIVDYIYNNFSKNGKKIPKKELNTLSKEKLMSVVIVNHCEKQLEAWAKRPKLIKFMVDGKQGGKRYSWDCEYESEEECRKAFEEEGVLIETLVLAKGHHRCKYCSGIAEGTDKNLLCEECRAEIGHIFYSEL